MLFLILIMPLISSLEIDMKSSYNQGETLIVKISGNFLEPIPKEDVYFYKEHVRVPFDYAIAKINDEYYIYAMQEKEAGNYSIEIKNAKYMQGSEVIEEDLKIPFYITNQTADFSIDKGFVITSTEFSINAQNLQDEKITISFKFGGKENSTTLNSGEVKEINFDLSGLDAGLETLEMSSANLVYNIPIYVLLNETAEIEKREFKFEPGELNVSIATNSEITRIIYLYNNGDEILEDIEISLSNSLKDFANLSVYNLSKLEPNSSIKIEMKINSSDEEFFVQGQLKAKTPLDSYRYANVYLNFVKDYTPKAGEYGENSEPPGNLIDAEDLIDDTEKTSETSSPSTGKIVGWTIVAIVLVLLAWFFLKKYRGAKGFPTVLDRARGM